MFAYKAFKGLEGVDVDVACGNWLDDIDDMESDSVVVFETIA